MGINKVSHVAILGYGTVGSGVYELIPDKVWHVLDLRDFPDSPVQDILTRNFSDILDDGSIDIVVETIGGLNPAYDYVKRSLLAGKSVVTSNKELVSLHSAEFTRIAADKNVSFLYEASVGGGITIVRTLRQLRFVDKIIEITGILNGTTNYILSQMTEYGDSFDDALKEAQSLGYAEADPTADVEGYDAARKIAILASLATSRHVDSDKIPTKGISDITRDNITAAKENGYAIKLIASAKMTDDGVTAYVAPTLVPLSHPLSAVSDSGNAIYVKYAKIGDYMFQGHGAGKLPTAGAIVSNIIDIESVSGHISCGWNSEPAVMLTDDTQHGRLRKWV